MSGVDDRLSVPRVDLACATIDTVAAMRDGLRKRIEEVGITSNYSRTIQHTARLLHKNFG